MSWCSTLVLAGGRSRRLGGVEKATLLLRGQRLVDRVVAAAAHAEARPVIVIGPEHTGDQADLVVREDPPFTGPLASIAAGLPQVATEWVMILPCDLQHPGALIERLREAMKQPGADGVVLVDEDERVQWLAGCYRVQALRDGCAALGPRLANAPLRAVLAELELRRLPVENALCADLDTPEALAAARAQDLPPSSPQS
ncbi:molybdenum cofactor guanylyltransferase [Glutamicibacter endophyticus]|uniref:molybdenum cofactor guanylyltransferase n=1 Tax=Glutamicibacter endophyticus TaxID=1522174 RepID=UPI003AF18B1C